MTASLFTGPLPPDHQPGILIPGAPFNAPGTVWVVTFETSNINRLLMRVLTDPPGGISASVHLKLWLDTTKLSVAPSGLSTEYEPFHPIPMAAGRVLYVVWYTNFGTAPDATLFSESVMH